MNRDSVKTLQDLVIRAAEKYGSSEYIKEKRGKDISVKSFAQFAEDSRKITAFLSEKSNGKRIEIIHFFRYNQVVGFSRQ